MRVGISNGQAQVSFQIRSTFFSSEMKKTEDLIVSVLWFYKTLDWSYDIWETFSGVRERIFPFEERHGFPKNPQSVFLAI